MRSIKKAHKKYKRKKAEEWQKIHGDPILFPSCANFKKPKLYKVLFFNPYNHIAKVPIIDVNRSIKSDDDKEQSIDYNDISMTYSSGD